MGGLRRVAFVFLAAVGFGGPMETTCAFAFPASRPASGPSFDLDTWLKSVAAIDHATWNKRHPGPWSGWFDAKNDQCAQNYVITWGPLGIRTLMHDRSGGDMPAFRKLWPRALCDHDGELLYDCFEVIDVIPGTPAAGHLEKGDLLVAMDGGLFCTASSVRLDAPLWQHQASRSLELDAGERLDVAEGRGRVSFDVIRPPAETQAIRRAVTKEVHVTDELRGGGISEVDIEVPIAGATEVMMSLDLTRDGNGSCWGVVLEPRLTGPRGTLDLSQRRRSSERTGWGRIATGVNPDGTPFTSDGEPAPKTIWIHAPGHLAWHVPDGYDRFSAKLVSPSGRALGFRARVVLRTPQTPLPAELATAHRVVSFDIPKIGTYGRGFPRDGDAKSELVAKMTAGWLAGQQQPDGSWKRTCGYTHNGYDTAWAALGLLSHADPAYDEHVRKAAEYLAFACPQDDWAVPNAMMVLFLSEYWLRTHDHRILVALQSQVERIVSELTYADWNSGHGLHPGYRGGGVSVGGSHVALALAVANLTPVKVEAGLVDRMLARAQELAPSGFVPYGRGTGTRTFEPNLQAGATYSGRHGPYLIASLIHGGPKLFTENCSALYSHGDVGGLDQGHATQTMSMSWGLLAAAAVGPEALGRQTDALRWKLVMLRCADGGFCQNPYRLEYQGGEGLLPAVIRGGGYLVMLNSPKRNLAVTGADQWRAKSFPDLPPVCHDDAAALSYYQRNWGVASAVLGADAPRRLRDGTVRLLSMGKTADTRAEVFDFLMVEAAPTAKEILALASVAPMLRQYLAEMVLGVDLRIAVEPTPPDPATPQWTVTLDAQHPLAGWMVGATSAERAEWRRERAFPMVGSVEIVDADGSPFLNRAAFPLEPDWGDHGWHTRSLSKTMDGPSGAPIPLVARVRYSVGDMEFAYDRPIIAGGDEPGNAEKGRKLLGDRVVWVPGTLRRDLGGWNAAFTLPSGQYVAAATQGNFCTATRDDIRWVAPEDGAVAAGTQCEFGFSSGWQPVEGRIAAMRLLSNLDLPLTTLRSGEHELDRVRLSDFNRSTSERVKFPDGERAAITLALHLADEANVRGVDLRLERPRDVGMTIDAWHQGTWQPVFQGRPSGRLSAFQPVKTKQLRVTLSRLNEKVDAIDLQELRVVRASDS